jgi:hypothetical protein
MLPGETQGVGGPKACPDCKEKLVPEVLFSAAGHYIGTRCKCGPFSRESGYYKKHQDAEKDLKGLIYGRPSGFRPE